MTNKIIVMDIGSKDIIAMLATRNSKNKIHVTAIEELQIEGISNGEVKDKKKVNKALQEILKKLQAKEYETINDIYVVNNNRFIRHSRESVSLPIKQKKIGDKHIKSLYEKAKTTRLQKEQKLIDIMAGNFFVDNQKIIGLPIGLGGKNLSAYFNFITANKNLVNSLKSCIEFNGFTLQRVFASPLVTSSILLSDQQKVTGIAILNLEDETTSFAVFYEGILEHFLTLPFGWNHVIKDIQTACNINQKKAIELYDSISKNPDIKNFTIKMEEEKVTYTIDDKTLKYIIYARLFEIIEGINNFRRLDKIKYKFKNGIIVTGRYTKTIFLKKLLHQITHVNVFYNKKPKMNYINETEVNLKHPKYDALLGATYEVFKKNSNSFESIMRDQITKKRKLSLFN